MTDNNSDSIGRDLGAIPGSRERGQEVVPALTGFDPARMNLIVGAMAWVKLNRCSGEGMPSDCYTQEVLRRLNEGCEIMTQLVAIAMEAATAGETCNRLAPKGDSAGRRHRPNTVATQPTGEGSQ